MTEYAEKMSRAELAEHAGDFMLPYTADSMRAPLRELGVQPLERTGVAGTKTTQVAYYDPTVLWVLALSYHRAKAWPSKTPALKELLDEYYKDAQKIDFIEGCESWEHLWRRVAYWRLLIDVEHGMDLRLLDRIVRGFSDSVGFDMSGLGVLEAVLSAYKQHVVESFGHTLGGADGVVYEDPWELLGEVLDERGLVAQPSEIGGEAQAEVIQVIQRLG